ncbi:hypothetical protein FACS1894116_03670 [Betaproteobacteria bacterium]|nr:hypothetical protein FACS1894116_03670 [Betaproteobacteria bacterium]GHU25362.1 hypothetical protein FACS189488_12220 [Betaproteobacteria bacterium]GHU29214.1 hypothetical protein FACS189497_06740 [Betaproteobacteria bacterium]
MATDLALSITIGAAAGAAMSVFSNLKGRMQAVADVTSKLKADQRKLGETIKAAARLPITNLHELQAQYGRQQAALDRLRTSTKKLGQVQASIAANEANRAGLRTKMMETAGIAYLAVQPMKVAISAEEAMADVKKVVDERVPELEQYLLDASRRIPKSFEGLAQIASSGAQGGISRADLEGYVDLVSKMAVAGDLSDEFAGESVAKIKNIFGTNMAKMGELGDVINNLSNRESAKFSQIIDVMKRSGSTAKLYGFTENQTAGLATAFLALGKTEETAGTAINAILLKLQAADVQGNKFQTGLKKMGLSAQGLKKAIGEDAEGALSMFLEKVRALPKADQMGALSQMFGTQYADEVALLANNLDVYKRAMGEATDATQYAGSMEAEFASRSDTTSNSLQLLKNDLIVIAIQLGKVMLPALRELVETVRPWFASLAEWVKENHAIVRGTLKFIGFLLGMKIALLACVYAASMLYAPLLHLIKIFRMGQAAWVLFGAMRAMGGIKAAFPILGKLATLLTTVGGALGKMLRWLGPVIGRGLIAVFTGIGKGMAMFGVGAIKVVMMVGKAFLWMARIMLMNPIGLIITDLEAAWAAGKDIEHPGVKALVDRIGGELIRLRTRLGHKAAVAAFLPELDKRTLAGTAASQFVTLAREGLWQMENPDGTTFMCGPLALEQLRGDGSTLDLTKLPPLKVGGYNLTELTELAHRQHQNVSAIYRERGAKVPVPSVVHWKSGHYAALTSAATHRDGRYYHVRDAALGRDTWISEAALEDEASGYFLATAPEQTEPGWRLASAEESQAVIGAGETGGVGGSGDGGSSGGCPGAPGGVAGNSNSCQRCLGASGGSGDTPDPAAMIQHSTEAMIVSLALSDTPVVYRPPKGPQVPLTLAYNQREINQPATFTYSNIGPGWSFAGTPHIIDDPDAPTSNVKLYLATGGSHHQIDFNSDTQAFAPDTADQSVLVRVSSTPVIYERRLANGGKEIYSVELLQGSTRRVFLTQVIDAAGNTLTYHYNNASGSPRLQGFTDASGGVTTLEYTHADPLKITGIVDPFGRKATITYDSLGRLSFITDVIGIVSQVTYRDTGTFIERLDTPYGATLFDYGESDTTRWLEITDAQGKKERIEFRHNAPDIAYSDPDEQVPADIWPFNSNLNNRNTFYWDASAQSQYPGDYTKAEILHWHHDRLSLSLTSDVLESTKHPLESRVWYNYPGQDAAYLSGTCDKPSSIARVLPDGSTQITKMEYNAQGNMTRRIDPLGRETKYDYAANGIDLTRAQQKTATGWDTLIEITWNTQHRPLTVKDAAGRITQYTYNAAGQLTSQTNALNQTTSYSYDAAGRLTQIKNPLNHVESTYTYDQGDCT